MRLSLRYLLALGAAAIVLVLVAVGAAAVAKAAPSPEAFPPAPVQGPRPAAAGQSATPAFTAATERQLLDKYCITCHSTKAREAGLDSARKLTVDNLDVTNIAHDAKTWELIARKLRAGMMPPAGMPRPDAPMYESMAAWLEQELDRNASAHTPPPGLHRLNRTEYANVVRTCSICQIDPAKYLPSDDSTAGFDNIAGALGISSTLVEAYVSAAQKISRLALGGAEDPTLVVYRTREDTTQDYHIEGSAVRYARRLAGQARVSIGWRVHDHGDADLRRQHVADRLRLSGLREARDPARRRATELDELAWRRPRGGGQLRRPQSGGRANSGQAGPEAFFGRRPPDARPIHHDGRTAHGWRDLPGQRLRAAAGSRSPLPRARPSRPARRRGIRSSRTSAPSASKVRSTLSTARIRRAAARSSPASRPAPPPNRRVHAGS